MVSRSKENQSEQKHKGKFQSKYSSEEEEKSDASNNTSSNESMDKTNDPETQKKFRTELCKFFEISGSCKFGDNCIFAHGKENLREKIVKKSGYKKRHCLNFFENGICLYGNRCQFSHETKEPFFSYCNVMNDITKGNISNELFEVFKRPRLKAFKKILRHPKKKKKTYFDDIIIIQSKKKKEV